MKNYFSIDFWTSSFLHTLEINRIFSARPRYGFRVITGPRKEKKASRAGEFIRFEK